MRPLLTLVDPVAVALAALVVRDHVSAMAVVAAALAATVVSRAGDLHRSRLVLSVLEELPRLALASLVATVTLLAAAPLGGLAGRPAWAPTALFAGCVFGFLVLLRGVVYTVTHVARRSGRTAHPVIVVGAGVVGRRLTEAFLSRREYGLTPVGMIDCGPDLRARDLPVPLLGGVGSLGDAMADLGVNDVVFAFPGPPDGDTVDAVRHAVQSDHQVFVVPRFFEMMGVDHHRTELIRDVAVTRLRRSGRRAHTLLLKRALDLTVASVAMVLLAPVMAVLALAVRLETGPGVIFRQTRIGLRGRSFTLFKFRSLRPATHDEGATTWSIDHDARLGPVGRFIRRTSLDELPQLVNVWRGDMSLVGPRPERPHFVREFSQSQERYEDRHRVPTGMTGWAQVNDLRGDTSISDRVRFDNYYIENWSLWGDIKIIVRTVRAVIRPQSSPPRILALTPPEEPQRAA
ncbi:sugar transferase [Nocardioides sp. cx-169]|uniref:sugar transferase n=1 Tax=Nocardioides sp. cx-169 TaxID=2899080 RepID=UPI001E58DF35|nr:sugar transferase [Nocardioides sp. cx-169]MCD4534502.1 sugar transferase [Nocardioides sp. cx-169]